MIIERDAFKFSKLKEVFANNSKLKRRLKFIGQKEQEEEEEWVGNCIFPLRPQDGS